MSVSMHVHLIVPAPLEALTGGYVYDRAMIAELRALGSTVEVTELAGRHPLPDATALAAARSAWQARPGGAVPLIDGLGLPAFAPLQDDLVQAGAVGLIHHPTALETGRDAASRDQLKAIEREVMPRLRRIVVTSADTARRLAAEFGVEPERIVVVEPGTSDAPRSDGPILADACSILSVGTLTPRKGHDILLRAVARLPDLPLHLTIVGGELGSEHARHLRDLTGELGLEGRVTLTGSLTQAALEPHWRRAGVFALATHYEGYGMAIAEAFRRGVPVAVTADAGLAARIPAGAGVVAPPGDHEALANGLRRIVFDVDLRRGMADGAWVHGRKLPGWSGQARLLSEALLA